MVLQGVTYICLFTVTCTLYYFSLMSFHCLHFVELNILICNREALGSILG